MKYAIVESGGKQYKAVEGNLLEVDRLPVEPGKQVKLEQVLLLADEGTITVGTPLVKDNPIWTTVVGHFKGRKVINFNYSPKKRIRVKTGHRQNFTRLLVEQIGGKELLQKEPSPKAAEVEKDEKLTPKVKVTPTKTSAPAKKPTSVTKKAATTAKKTVTKSATKAAPAKTKTTTKPAHKTPAKKPTSKPAAGKTTKTTEKSTQSSKKKPVTTGKKPAAK